MNRNWRLESILGTFGGFGLSKDASLEIGRVLRQPVHTSISCWRLLSRFDLESAFGFPEYLCYTNVSALLGDRRPKVANPNRLLETQRHFGHRVMSSQIQCFFCKLCASVFQIGRFRIAASVSVDCEVCEDQKAVFSFPTTSESCLRKVECVK